MTTIVAYHVPEYGTVIGSDTQLSTENMRCGPRIKWVKHNSWAVGVAGDLRSLDVIANEASTLLHDLHDEFQFTIRLNNVFVKHGFTSMTDSPGPACWGQQIMLANKHGVWDIDGTLGIFRVPDNMVWCSGSGRDFAFGASKALESFVMAPEKRVSAIIQTAMYWDIASGGECYIDTLPIQAPKSTEKTEK